MNTTEAMEVREKTTTTVRFFGGPLHGETHELPGTLPKEWEATETVKGRVGQRTTYNLHLLWVYQQTAVREDWNLVDLIVYVPARVDIKGFGKAP